MTTKYIITKERLISLLQAELRDKIANCPKCLIHHDADIEYWTDKLKSKAATLDHYWHEEGIELVPYRGALIERVESAFVKDVNGAASFYEDNEFGKSLIAMNNQCVYEMFGVSIDTIEGATWISSCIVNGLYDDAYLGVRYEGGYPRITMVGDNYFDEDGGTCIYEEDLTELIRVKKLAKDYYDDNKNVIENKPKLNIRTLKDSPSWQASMEYMRLCRQYDDLLETYMDNEGKSIRQEERDKHIRDVAELKASLKQPEENK